MTIVIGQEKAARFRTIRPANSIVWRYQTDDANTVVHYKFNEPSGFPQDYSGNGYHINQIVSFSPASWSHSSEAPNGMTGSLRVYPNSSTQAASTVQIRVLGPTSSTYVVPAATNYVSSTIFRIVGPTDPTKDSFLEIKMYTYGTTTGGMYWWVTPKDERAIFAPSQQPGWAYNSSPPPSYLWQDSTLFRPIYVSMASNNGTYGVAGWTPPAVPNDESTFDNTLQIGLNQWTQLVVLVDKELYFPRVIVNGIEKAQFYIPSYSPPLVQMKRWVETHLFDTSLSLPFLIGAREYYSAYGDGTYDGVRPLWVGPSAGYYVEFAEHWMSKGSTYHQNIIQGVQQ